MEDYFKTLKQIIEGDDNHYIPFRWRINTKGLPDFRSDANFGLKKNLSFC